MNTSARKKLDVSKYAILIVLIVVIVALSIAKPQFMTGDNILNILRQVSITGLIAVGMLWSSSPEV